jgi:hypothetical protein
MVDWERKTERDAFLNDWINAARADNIGVPAN